MRKGIRQNLTRTRIVCLVLLLALGSIGVTYAHWSDTVFVSRGVQTGEFSGFTACSTNDPLDTIDPGKDKDVASCTAELASPENSGWEQVIVTIDNAYPCYESEIYVTLQNHGTVPGTIAAVTITNPPELTVTEISHLQGTDLNPGESADGTFSVHLEQSAAQGTTYTFTIEIVLVLWYEEEGGSTGFWQNWEAHYSGDQLTEWLQAIDAEFEPDDWLVPDKNLDGNIDYEDWDLIRADGIGGGATPESRFLMHYCATRLNVEAGRLYLESTHDITSISGYGYLGLSEPASATLSEIISGIELKYGTTDIQLLKIMKDICDALNNLSI